MTSPAAGGRPTFHSHPNSMRGPLCAVALAATLLAPDATAQSAVQLTTLHASRTVAAAESATVSGRFVRIRPLASGDVRIWAAPTSPVFTPVTPAARDAEPSDLAEGAPELALGDPFPNPVSARATLPFTLAATGPARLTLHDMLGREVAVLTDRELPEGSHRASLDTRGLAAGVYVVRLDAGDVTRLARITIVR